MQLKKREVQRIFDKLELEVRSTHHTIGWFVYKGRKILKTRVSFGQGDIPLSVVHKLRGQLKLSLADFIALKDCPLSRDGYIAILKAKGFIVEDDEE
ncbi:MAG TPA: hypothetical protein PLJ78_09245 [Anaerolineae bacterium]|nr:hypothetical protein [Anaerolineae bacterium]HQK14112.1 hypothetical protein [Anaerolineae bacterium]